MLIGAGLTKMIVKAGVGSNPPCDPSPLTVNRPQSNFPVRQLNHWTYNGLAGANSGGQPLAVDLTVECAEGPAEHPPFALFEALWLLFQELSFQNFIFSIIPFKWMVI